MTVYSPRSVRELGDEIERHVGVPREERKAMSRRQLKAVIGEVDALFQRMKAITESIAGERAAYVTQYGEEDTSALAEYAAYELRRADYCLSYLRFVRHMME